MSSLMFITPAYKRYELTRICMAERRWACDVMQAQYGIEASCVIVADDENLDIADEFGFHKVDSKNDFLGKKFNDGHEYAARNGYDFTMPMGSDSWIDPLYFSGPMPASDQIMVSRSYCLYPPQGDIRGHMYITWIGGVAFVIPRALLAKTRFRPCNEYIAKGCDTHTWDNIIATSNPTRILNDHHDLELVAFQTAGNKITNYHTVMSRFGMRHVSNAPFQDLYRHYPSYLVEQIESYYDRN